MPNHSTFRLWAGPLLAFSLLASGRSYAVEATTGHKYSASDLRNYSETLVAVIRIRQALAAQEANSPKTDHTMLESNAAAKIAKLLDRRGLDRATFNAISARVESQPAVRSQVNQMVMDEVIKG